MSYFGFGVSGSDGVTCVRDRRHCSGMCGSMSGMGGCVENELTVLWSVSLIVLVVVITRIVFRVVGDVVNIFVMNMASMGWGVIWMTVRTLLVVFKFSSVVWTRLGTFVVIDAQWVGRVAALFIRMVICTASCCCMKMAEFGWYWFVRKGKLMFW